MIKVVICDGAGSIQLPRPSPEMRGMLEDLPNLGIELAVASNGFRGQVERNFRAAGLDIPRIIVTRQDMGVAKPSPKFVYRVRDLAGVALNEIVYIGDSDGTDSLCAINAKVLPFAAHYSTSGKPMEYGLPVPHPTAFHQYLATFGKQKAPYFGWNFDEKCPDSDLPVLVRVLFGDHGSLGITQPLKTILKDQRSVAIGRYDIPLATILFQYLVSQSYLSGIIHDVDWITIYPGHKANSVNPLLKTFSSYLAKAFTQRFIPDLLIRHAEAPKSQFIPGDKRSIFNQFQTIMVNDAHQRRLKYKSGKTILVLDDFTTSGCSLETARRMLLQAGAKQVVGMAVAKYRQTHTVTRITRDWNPYEPCTLTEEDIEVANQCGNANQVADAYFHDSIWSRYSR